MQGPLCYESLGWGHLGSCSRGSGPRARVAEDLVSWEPGRESSPFWRMVKSYAMSSPWTHKTHEDRHLEIGTGNDVFGKRMEDENTLIARLLTV